MIADSKDEACVANSTHVWGKTPLSRPPVPQSGWPREQMVLRTREHEDHLHIEGDKEQGQGRVAQANLHPGFVTRSTSMFGWRVVRLRTAGWS